ncbi:5570_t:CDS:2 [Gigaspora margarita]|uniref:5570_t:CDS:1 n=1 Tax=Gigaspora margarita TaxID=4874 RepID=A0ABN7URF3_GIGMA|nr:5570_t:CDS:2 [Gigaspora margarita]
MDPRHVENDNCSEHKEDRNQTPVNPPLPPPGQNGNPNQEPLYINLNQAKRKQANKPMVQILPQARNVNLCDLDDTGYYPEGEDAFVTPVARHQPYSTQRPRRNLKKSENKTEKMLRANLPEVDPIIPHAHDTTTSSGSPTARARLHFTEKLMYLTYRNKTTKVPISTDSGSPIKAIEEPSESKETFDEFEYNEEALKEAEGFYTKEISDDDIF